MSQMPSKVKVSILEHVFISIWVEAEVVCGKKTHAQRCDYACEQVQVIRTFAVSCWRSKRNVHVRFAGSVIIECL